MSEQACTQLDEDIRAAFADAPEAARHALELRALTLIARALSRIARQMEEAEERNHTRFATLRALLMTKAPGSEALAAALMDAAKLPHDREPKKPQTAAEAQRAGVPQARRTS